MCRRIRLVDAVFLGRDIYLVVADFGSERDFDHVGIHLGGYLHVGIAVDDIVGLVLETLVDGESAERQGGKIDVSVVFGFQVDYRCIFLLFTFFRRALESYQIFAVDEQVLDIVYPQILLALLFCGGELVVAPPVSIFLVQQLRQWPRRLGCRVYRYRNAVQFGLGIYLGDVLYPVFRHCGDRVPDILHGVNDIVSSDAEQRFLVSRQAFLYVP